MKLVHKKINKHQKGLLDILTFVAGLLLPIATIPQAYDIWVSKKTAGVSLTTWLLYLIASTLFAVYGIKHKEKLLIWTYIPFVIIECFIVVGLLIINT
jgi:uncharacterized protein with PQ loop repeat